MAGADRDSSPAASEPPTDLVERLRWSMEATNRRDFETALSVFAEEASFDVSSAGLGVFTGRPAVRAYLEDWVGAYEEQRFSAWEGEELGGGVVFVVATFEARPLGSPASVQERWAFTCRWAAGQLLSVRADGDVEQARVRAQGLAAQAGAGR